MGRNDWGGVGGSVVVERRDEFSNCWCMAVAVVMLHYQPLNGVG